jgi:cold shock CspA family protein
MKRLLLFIMILVMCSSFMQDDNYYIMFIKGNAVNTVTGRGSRMGDMLRPSDKILLKDANSKVVLFHSKKGRLEITPSSAGKDLTVKDQAVSIKSEYKIISRPLNYEGYNPRTYFHSPETNHRVLLVTGLPLKIIPFYKLDAQNFFYLTWEKNGATIVRKIPASDRGIYFNSSVISDADQLTDGQKVKFCYQHFEYGVLKNDVLAEFVPVVASLSVINQQISIIKKHSPQKENRILNALITAHLNDNYGKVGSEYLQKIR